MAQNYTRQSTFSDGDTITSSLFNDEYNQLVNVFTYSSASASTTGHRHDGTAGQGGNIFKIGDLDFLNKIEVDSTNNRWGFYVEVSSAAVEQIRIQDGSVVPVTTNDIDLGTSSLQFKDLYIDGTANVDSLTLTSGSTVTTILDEDDLSSDSATALVTQQSVKAYVDAQVTAQDLDFQADSGGALSIDLDSEALTLTGGTGVDTSGSGNAVTFAIDSTVTTLTGSQTLTNKTLTSPDVNTPDIDGGTIDGTVIGGATPAAVSATTVSATGNVTVGGTVDGRDVAADGTKLDTVETNADVTDTTNVTAAGALMDSEVTNLDQVKAFDSADYATAAQGTTADNALPKTGGAMTGAITTNSTFDGRDVATDGTKLDGIEASADVTDTANVTAAGAVMDSELTDIAAVKALNQGVATTDSPTFAGATVNGTVEFDGLSGTGAVTVTDILDQDNMSSNSATALATQQSIKSYVDSQVATSDTLAEVLANGNATGGTDVAFGDSDKAIFGAGSDLQVYHSGTSSFVRDLGDGDLNLWGTNVTIGSASGNLNLTTVAGGATTLLHGNAAKLATTSTGIDVTGTAVTDGLTVDGNILLNNESNELQFNTSSTPVNKIYADDTYTANGLTISADNGVALKSTNNYLLLDDTGTNEMVLNVDGGERMRVTSTGIDVTGTVTADGLTVDGTATTAATFNTNVNGSQLVINDGTAGTQPWNVGVKNDGTNDFLIYNLGSENIELYTANSIRQKIASNGDISFYEDTGTTAKLFWDASAESLGIGSSSVRAKLDIVSSTSATPTDFNASSIFIEETGNNKYAGLTFVGGNNLGNTGTVGKLLVQNTNTSGGFEGAMMFSTRSSSSSMVERMRIDSAGNVGIGCTPSYPLEIQSGGVGTVLRAGTSFVSIDSVGSESSPSLIFNGDGDTGFWRPASDTLAVSTAGSERMRIDSSGNVGIGTSTAGTLHGASYGTTQLHIDGGTDRGQMLIEGDTLALIGLSDNGATADSRVFLTLVNDGVMTFKSVNDNGTTKANIMSLTSAGNVGINTSSPDQSLVVNGQIGLSYDGTNSYQGLKRSGVGTVYYTGTTSTTTDAIHTFTGSSDAVKMTILEGGNVGIGTDSPSYRADILATNQYALRLNTTDADGCFLAIQTNGTAKGYLGSSHHLVNGTPSENDITLRAENNLQFTSGGGAERMRIDSSGNLLVGTTDTTLLNNTTGGGFSVSSNGFTQIAKQGVDSADPVLILNQTGLDGEIQRFYKDGASVGSVGSEGGNSLYIGNDDANLRFSGGSNAIVPAGVAGASSNGLLDLGLGGLRFKDLYLSGGVHLGGTGSANKLDDYEEGTWTGGTLGLTNCSSVTTSNLTYTKIGRLVTLQGQFNLTVTSADTEVRITFTTPFNQSIALTPATGSAFGNFGSNENARIMGVVVNHTGNNATEFTVLFPSADVEAASSKITTFSITYETT